MLTQENTVHYTRYDGVHTLFQGAYYMEFELSPFVIYLTENKKASQSTVTSYQRDLKKLEHYLNAQGVDCVEEVTSDHLNRYLSFLDNQGMSISTISRNVASMKAYFHYLFSRENIQTDPTSGIKAPHIDRKMPEILSREEVVRLLNQPSSETPKGRRDRAMLELLYATGVRVSELISVKYRDVNMRMNYIICRDADKERMIPFGSSARIAMEDYMHNGRGELLKGMESEYLFVNCSGDVMSRQGFWKLIKQYARRAGIYAEITPHTLRHSFAAHLVENGADLKVVQEMMGHSDISTTQMYVSLNMDRVRRVYNESHPRH